MSAKKNSKKTEKKKESENWKPKELDKNWPGNENKISKSSDK